MEPQINYSQVEAIAPSKTLGYCNNFVINMVQFLNRFSFLCDRKLAAVSSRIQKLEITMNILDAKLASIPALASVDAASVDSAADAVTAPPPQGVAAAPAPPPPPPPPAAGGAPPPPAGAVTYRTDPRYQLYFRMLSHLPRGQVEQRLVMDGVPVDILDRGDEIVPQIDEDNDNDDDDDDFGSEEDTKSVKSVATARSSKRGGPPPPPPPPPAVSQPLPSAAADDDDFDEPSAIPPPPMPGVPRASSAGGGSDGAAFSDSDFGDED